MNVRITLVHVLDSMRRVCLELLLILSVALLIGQLALPCTLRWWRRPGPGSIGVDQLDASIDGIADDFVVYLPESDGREMPPLVVFLHGSGQRGSDPFMLINSGPFAAIESGLRATAVVAGPQCRLGGSWEPDSVARFVEDLAARYDVDRERIYLVGYSMGGYGTWQAAAEHPELFAAIAPISGGGVAAHASLLAKVPIWAFHGAKDETVQLVQSQRMIDAVRQAGGQPKLTIFPDAGHGICETVCRREDLWHWLLTQHRRTRQTINVDPANSPPPDLQ